MPQLADPNFRRAVVLLLKASEAGALGLVINRPSQMTLVELCESQSIPCHAQRHERVMIGGPCEPESHLLVLNGDQPVFAEDHPDELVVTPTIRLVTAREGLERLADRPQSRIRCYLGYAGWGPGQLEDELAEGTWVPLPSDDRLVFDRPHADIWQLALRAAGIDPVALIQPGGDELN